MMGIKLRQFGPPDHVSIEDLVPRDQFYRHVNRTLDLSLRHGMGWSGSG